MCQSDITCCQNQSTSSSNYDGKNGDGRSSVRRFGAMCVKQTRAKTKEKLSVDGDDENGCGLSLHNSLADSPMASGRRATAAAARSRFHRPPPPQSYVLSFSVCPPATIATGWMQARARQLLCLLSGPYGTQSSLRVCDSFLRYLGEGRCSVSQPTTLLLLPPSSTSEQQGRWPLPLSLLCFHSFLHLSIG